MDRYTVSTWGYAVVGMFALVVGLFNWRNWVLLIVCIVAILVCLDNFFCSSRACKAGYSAQGHWSLPPFFRRKP